MWTRINVTVAVTLDIADWHVSALWLDDPSLEHVMLTKSGEQRVNPWDPPDAILADVLDALCVRVGEEDWRIR